MPSRFEAKKFTGKNDFALWRMKMRAMLIQQGLASALSVEDQDEKGKEVLDVKATAKKAEIEAKAHIAIVLCLGDKVLREVAKEKTVASILMKLEELYLTKSLVNRMFMKHRLYSYKFLEGKEVLEQLEEFNKAVDDLENINVTIGDEDKAILLLNVPLHSFDQFRDVLLYGRDRTITLLEVQTALRAKKLQKGELKASDASAESLNVKKFKGKKTFKKPQESSKNLSSGQKETRSCHWCKKPGHLKKDCFAWKRKQKSEGKAVNSTEGAEDDDEAHEGLNVMEGRVLSSWIMDSGCSFHMSHDLGWFEEIEEATGSVILGNNQVCNIKGVGTVTLKRDDGLVVALTGVRYIPDVKRNIISLGFLERKSRSFSSIGGKMRLVEMERH